MFNVGIWDGLKDVRDPELQGLAERLPNIALLSRREGTVNNYVSAYKKWKAWTDKYSEIKCLPADPKYVALYLLNLQEHAHSHAPISLSFYALSWIHRTAGLPDPTEHPLPRMVRDSATRSLGKGDNKKKPLRASDLHNLVLKLDNGNLSLLDMRTLTMCLLAFAGFFRYDEVSQIRRSDIVFAPMYVKIFVEKSKTDVYREGKWVFVGRTCLITCPVSMLFRYLKQANITPSSSMYIFRAMTFFRKTNVHKLRAADKPISYTTTREFMLNAFDMIGLVATEFGTHSLRAGGATAAANNFVNDRLFRKHGRWLSEKAKDGYVVEDLQQVLSVSLSLGI